VEHRLEVGDSEWGGGYKTKPTFRLLRLGEAVVDRTQHTTENANRERGIHLTKSKAQGVIIIFDQCVKVENNMRCFWQGKKRNRD